MRRPCCYWSAESYSAAGFSSFLGSQAFDKEEGWYGETAEGEHLPADAPDAAERPPYSVKRKPFMADGVDLKGWETFWLALFWIWGPDKQPADKEIYSRPQEP